MKTPDAYPASDADSFDCTDTIGHTDPVGMLSLLGALAVATRRRGAWPSRPPREDTHRTH